MLATTCSGTIFMSYKSVAIRENVTIEIITKGIYENALVNISNMEDMIMADLWLRHHR